MFLHNIAIIIEHKNMSAKAKFKKQYFKTNIPNNHIKHPPIYLHILFTFPFSINILIIHEYDEKSKIKIRAILPSIGL